MEKVKYVTVLVCGGRKLSAKKVADRLTDLFDLTESSREALDIAWSKTRIVHGGATGADTGAEIFADKFDFDEAVYRADWTKYGRGAGPIRNQEMLDSENVDFVIAFWNGSSPGTKDMIGRASKQDIPVLIMPTKDLEISLPVEKESTLF